MTNSAIRSGFGSGVSGIARQVVFARTEPSSSLEMSVRGYPAKLSRHGAGRFGAVSGPGMWASFGPLGALLVDRVYSSMICSLVAQRVVGGGREASAWLAMTGSNSS